jgi:hypothetical protein
LRWLHQDDHQLTGRDRGASAGIRLSAYVNPSDGTVVVVAINNNAAATPLSLFVSGVVPR